jgi:hypothetical protein
MVRRRVFRRSTISTGEPGRRPGSQTVWKSTCGEFRRMGRRRAFTWRQPDGSAVSCAEKLKVLNENLEEIREMCQDAFEDALLLGCDETQIREVFADVVASLRNPYAKQ